MSLLTKRENAAKLLLRALTWIADFAANWEAEVGLGQNASRLQAPFWQGLQG